MENKDSRDTVRDGRREIHGTRISDMYYNPTPRMAPYEMRQIRQWSDAWGEMINRRGWLMEEILCRWFDGMTHLYRVEVFLHETKDTSGMGWVDCAANWKSAFVCFGSAVESYNNCVVKADGPELAKRFEPWVLKRDLPMTEIITYDDGTTEDKTRSQSTANVPGYLAYLNLIKHIPENSMGTVCTDECCHSAQRCQITANRSPCYEYFPTSRGRLRYDPWLMPPHGMMGLWLEAEMCNNVRRPLRYVRELRSVMFDLMEQLEGHPEFGEAYGRVAPLSDEDAWSAEHHGYLTNREFPSLVDFRSCSGNDAGKVTS